MISFWAYYILSTIVLVVTVQNALTSRGFQYYQTAISLIKTKYSLMIIFNFAAATAFGFIFILLRFFFGELREIEKMVKIQIISKYFFRVWLIK